MQADTTHTRHGLLLVVASASVTRADRSHLDHGWHSRRVGLRRDRRWSERPGDAARVCRSRLMLFGTAESFIHPVFAPAAEPLTAQRLLSLGPAGEHALGIALPENTAAELRLAAGGRLLLPELGATALEAPPAGRILVVRARAAMGTRTPRLRARACGRSVRSGPPLQRARVPHRSGSDSVAGHTSPRSLHRFPARAMGHLDAGDARHRPNHALP